MFDTNPLHTLNLHTATCQLYLNKNTQYKVHEDAAHEGGNMCGTHTCLVLKP